MCRKGGPPPRTAPAANAGLVEDGLEVVLHGVGGDVQGRGDLLRVDPLQHQTGDVALARGEPERRDGPMPGHDADMPVHYDLQVWTGKRNPAGIYTPFNPSVSC